jgi:indole-3-glycerol phosphate synthase
MDILDRFIAQAKLNVSGGYYEIGGSCQAGVSKPSLKSALSGDGLALIAEIKHASPAGEYSFSGIDVEAIARRFRDSGADAISVVVEPRIFKGDLGNIPMAGKAGLPVLFKDFVISDEQIHAASALGAGCILLIVKVADRLSLELDSMIQSAHSEGLEVLLECYDEEEMRRAVATDADILGINNRDLRTLHTDLERTRSILQGFDKAGRDGKPVVSESGIRSRKDAEFVRDAGADGILVGTALWLSSDQASKISELRSFSDSVIP